MENDLAPEVNLTIVARDPETGKTETLVDTEAGIGSEAVEIETGDVNQS